MRPYNKLVHPRGWRAFMEYGNGIVGDMCVHMLDMTRWMLDLGWPTRVASTGGILVDKQSKANISDTQTATFDFAGSARRVAASHLGRVRRSQISMGRDLLWRQGHAEGRAYTATTLHRRAAARPIHQDYLTNWSKYPEDKTEKELEKHVAPAIRRHMQNFLANIDSRGKARRRH